MKKLQTLLYVGSIVAAFLIAMPHFGFNSQSVGAFLLDCTNTTVQADCPRVVLSFPCNDTYYYDDTSATHYTNLIKLSKVECTKFNCDFRTTYPPIAENCNTQPRE